MKVELRFADKAPTTNEAQRVVITDADGCTYEFFARTNGGLLVRACEPLHHVLLIMPFGANSAVLFHKEEPK